jgi:hypothetical protein
VSRFGPNGQRRRKPTAKRLKIRQGMGVAERIAARNYRQVVAEYSRSMRICRETHHTAGW